MSIKPSLQLVLTLLLSLLNYACSGDSNLIALTIPDEHKESFDSLLELGKARYDAHDLAGARLLLEKAYSINSRSEDAALSLGFVYLGLAGITPFGLAQKLNQQSIDKKSAAAENKDETDSESNTEKTEGASDVLGQLSDIILLSDDDFDKLGFLNNSVADLPVIEPHCAGQTRSTINSLKFANRAISLACPFVDLEIRIEGESRHLCSNYLEGRKEPARAHFLWSLSHIVEAIAFQAVLSYSTGEDQSKTNLEKRVDAIQNIEILTPGDIASLAGEVKNLNTTISKVIQLGDDCSDEFPQTQFTAFVNDMISVSNGFAHIPGIPPDISASITKSMEEVVKLQESSSKADLGAKQSQAMKGDVTKKIAETLSKKVNSIDKNDISEKDASDICKAYDEISANKENDPNRPDICI